MCQYVFLKVWYFFPVTIVRELEQHPLVINNMVAKQARAGGFQRESLTGTHLGPTICNTPVKKVKIDMSLWIHHLWNEQHNHTSQTNCTVCKNFYIIYIFLHQCLHTTLRSSVAPLLCILKESGTFQDTTATFFNSLPSHVRNIKDYGLFCKSIIPLL